MSIAVIRNPNILGGAPVFGGTRFPVSVILACLCDGYSEADILQAYPRLTKEHIRTACRYAADVVEMREAKPNLAIWTEWDDA